MNGPHQLPLPLKPSCSETLLLISPIILSICHKPSPTVLGSSNSLLHTFHTSWFHINCTCLRTWKWLFMGKMVSQSQSSKPIFTSNWETHDGDILHCQLTQNDLTVQTKPSCLFLSHKPSLSPAPSLSGLTLFCMKCFLLQKRFKSQI